MRAGAVPDTSAQASHKLLEQYRRISSGLQKVRAIGACGD